MTSFEPGDIVLVPFPYTEREARYRRPTLVVSRPMLVTDWPLLWVLMITSAENRPWPGDVHLGSRFGEAGLPDPSVVRTAKIANVELRGASRLGHLPADLMASVMAEIRSILCLDQH